jgi:hypothetical protein
VRMQKNLMVGILLLLLTGCGPTTVKTINTPLAGLTLTFETWENGPLVSDRTKLVAHYTHNGKEDTQVIFDGDYVVITEYRWSSQGLTLCYKSGTVANFTNEIGFEGEGSYHQLHILLNEHCAPRKT